MSNHDDFWTSLATGHTNTVLAGAMDSHLSGKSIDESFGSVRTLTDIHRQANALVLPVEAGTKVAFAGGLGAVMSYDDVPADGITGEVVTVKSATGEITHHGGKVFVKWADGKFRPIHAEHLRLAGQGKKAAVSRKKMENAIAGKMPPDSKKGRGANRVIMLTGDSAKAIGKDNYSRHKMSDLSEDEITTLYNRLVLGKTATEHASEDALKKYLKEHPGADESKHTVSEGKAEGKKDDRSAEEIGDNTSGDDVKALGRMDPAEGREKYGLSKDSMSALNVLLREARSGDLEDAFSEINGAIEKTRKHPSPKEGKALKKALIKIKDAMERETGVTWDDDEYEFVKKTASSIKAQFEKIKALAEKRPDSKFLKSILTQMADKGFAPTEKQMAVVKKIEDEIEQQGEMKKELKGLDKGAGFDASTIGERKGKPVQMDDEDKDTVGNFGQGEHHDMTDAARGKKATFRVASLGDLTDFLKVASGALVHKSTKDLWSYSKDADGNFLVSRLFDDEGEPLKV